VSSTWQVTISAGRFPCRLGLVAWNTIVSIVPPVGSDLDDLIED
jgi:hypothetical protein